jgi:putative hydroxymethylpyrimidine transport system substrate-binding protein
MNDALDRPTIHGRLVSTLLLVGIAAILVVLAGCGQKEDALGPKGSQKLTLMLDYLPNADHAGIYAAQAGGQFKQAGLDVKIRQPSDPSAPIKQVAAGRADLAISYEPEVLRARDQGLKVVAVGALVRKPLTSIISLPKGRIRSPRDLRGKTVGTAGIDYQSAYLRTILDRAGVDDSKVRTRNLGFNLVPGLVSNKVDAILGGFWNVEGIELAQQHRHPRIIPVNRAGVPTYNELVLVANQDALDREGKSIRSFIGALARATSALDRDPRSGTDALLRANPDLDPKLQRAAVKATLPLFLPASGKPFAYQDPHQWQAFAGWMHDNRLITHIPDATGAFDNSFLPGAGL